MPPGTSSTVTRTMIPQTESVKRFESGDVSIDLLAVRPMVITLVLHRDFDVFPTHIDDRD